MSSYSVTAAQTAGIFYLNIDLKQNTTDDWIFKQFPLLPLDVSPGITIVEDTPMKHSTTGLVEMSSWELKQ